MITSPFLQTLFRRFNSQVQYRRMKVRLVGFLFNSPNALTGLTLTCRIIKNNAHWVLSSRKLQSHPWNTSLTLQAPNFRIRLPWRAWLGNSHRTGNGAARCNLKVLGSPRFARDRPPSTIFRGLWNSSPAT